MNAIVLIGVILCSLAEEDKLVARLDAEFEASVAADPNQQQVREAARLLAETSQSGRHWQYRDALRILRQTRAKAAIPLLVLRDGGADALGCSGNDGDFVQTLLRHGQTSP